MKKLLIIVGLFLFCLSGMAFAESPGFGEDQEDQLEYVPDQLLVQFNEAVWDFPAGKRMVSVQELKNVDRDIADILERFGVYQVKLQFDVDRALEMSRGKYPERQWQALSRRLPNLRHRYLLYLKNPGDLQPLKLALNQLEQVKKISYNYYLKTDATTPDDLEYSSQWWPSSIGMPSAWDIKTDSSAIKVGIIDGGFQEDHDDLAANVKGTHDSVDGGDDPSSDLDACDSHGTHVAGIVGAVGDNGLGVTGVSWTASLYLYRMGSIETIVNTVTGEKMCESVSTDVEQAIMDAASDGVNIINNSNELYDVTSDCNVEDCTWLVDAVDALSDTILFVNSAGNGGSDRIGDDNDIGTDTPDDQFAALPNTLRVANSTIRGTRALSSNYGAITVHLAAPGSRIYSTIPTNTYGNNSGTSMSAPVVSGVAALAWSLCPTVLTATQVREVILDSVTANSNWSGYTATGGIVNGYGALRAAQSLCGADLIVDDVVVDPHSGDAGDSVSLSYTVSNVGTVNAGRFTVSVYFSEDTEITETDIYACQQPIRVGLRAGLSSSQSIPACTVPTTLADGVWYVGVLADSGDSITEGNETNNTAYDSTPFIVGNPGVPDLTLSNLTLDPYTGEPDASFTPTVDIRNGGDADAGAFTVSIVFSTDSSFDSSEDTTACSDMISGGLTAGDTRTSHRISDCRVPSIAAGTYYVGAIVDSNNEISESDESNNTTGASTQFMVEEGGTPDLSVYSIDSTYIIYLNTAETGEYQGEEGDAFTYYMQLQNLGDADSGSFEATVYFSSDTIISPDDDTMACSGEITSGVAVGDTPVESLSCTVPSVGDGTYYVGVILDTANDVAELDETNNTGYDQIPFTVGSATGSVCYFEKNSSTTVWLPNSDSSFVLNGTSVKTIEARFRWLGGDVSGSWHRLIEKQGTGTGWSLGLDQIGGIRAQINTDGTLLDQRTGEYEGITVDDGDWHTVAWVLDSGQSLVYVDGALAVDLSSSRNSFSGNTDSRSGYWDVYLGENHYGGSTPTELFSGDIDYIRVSDEARYSGSTYTIDPLEADGVTTALWLMDECSGTTLYDSSGNGYDLTATGEAWGSSY